MESISMFKIDKDIPYPEKNIPQTPLEIFPLQYMEVGDSFFIKKENPENHVHSYRMRVIHQAARMGRATGRTYEFKAKAGIDGIRVWRIK